MPAQRSRRVEGLARGDLRWWWWRSRTTTLWPPAPSTDGSRSSDDSGRREGDDTEARVPLDLATSFHLTAFLRHAYSSRGKFLGHLLWDRSAHHRRARHIADRLRGRPCLSRESVRSNGHRRNLRRRGRRRGVSVTLGEREEREALAKASAFDEMCRRWWLAQERPGWLAGRHRRSVSPRRGTSFSRVDGATSLPRATIGRQRHRSSRRSCPVAPPPRDR